jgi:hypothetical protein
MLGSVCTGTRPAPTPGPGLATSASVSPARSPNAFPPASASEPGSAQHELGLPDPTGPLAGVRWPAGSVHPGDLLRDDGRRLWVVPLSGRPRPVWTHPNIDVYEIAAGPDGTSLAFSVVYRGKLGILYLLEPDGSILTADVVGDYRVPETPVFVRAPTRPRGPIDLYWIRLSQDFDAGHARFTSQMMMLDERGRHAVAVPLRFGESVYQLSAYPGSPTSSLSLFRREDVPTRYEILRNDDINRGAALSSPTLLGYWISAANTDVASGVAWLTPRDYVVGVGQRWAYPTYALKRSRVFCEYRGSHPIHRGATIDVTYTEVQWMMLAQDASHVLVIGRRAATAIFRQRRQPAPWLLVDTNTGRITRTEAIWDPHSAWTVVRPAVPARLGIDPRCDGTRWTYP